MSARQGIDLAAAASLFIRQAAVAQNEARRNEQQAEQIERQKRDFRRLGVLGDWDHPYTTMSFDAEAAIVREIGKFLMNGGLYKGAKPVMWSVVEKTALAEAEVEYEDYTSDTVWVKFHIFAVTPNV